MVMAERQRSPLALVIHYQLCDLLNATHFALTHYLPLTLHESFLQNSSLGTPYQKWAKITSEEFAILDSCLIRLLAVAKLWYEQTVDLGSHEESAASKVAEGWFSTVKKEFRSCSVRQDAYLLEFCSLNLDGWLADDQVRFLNLWNFARPDDVPPAPLPSVVERCIRDISDRTIVRQLQEVGLNRLSQMRTTNNKLTTWIRSHYSIEEATAPHRGNMSSGGFFCGMP